MAWWTEQRLHPKAKNKFVVVFGTNFFIPSVKTVGKPKIDFDTKEYKLLNHKFNYPGNGTWQPIEIKFVDMNGLGDTNDTFDTSAFLWQILNNTGYAYPYLDTSSNTSKNPYYDNVVDGKVGATGGHHIATKLSYVQDDPSTKTNEKLTSFRTITTPEKSSTIANSFGKGLDSNIDKKSANYSRQKITIYQLSPEGDKEGKNPKVVECWHLVNPIVKSIGWGDLSYDSEELIEYSLNIVYDWAIYDRAAIGKPMPAFDAVAYKDFMKNFGLAQSTIDQEQSRQIFEGSEIDNMIRGTDLLESYDLDGDGIISRQEAERARLDAENQIANLKTHFDVNQDGEISEGERIFTEARIEEAETLLASAQETIQDFIDEFNEYLENQGQERKDRAALDEAFSDENIAEDVDALTDSLTLEEEVVIETGIDLRPEINEAARLEELTAISEKPENERTAEEQAALNQFKAEEQAERQADFDVINTSNAEQEILDEASTIIDAVPAGQTDEFVETLIEKVERGEASAAEIEIVTTELLRRGRANEDIDPADQDDTLDD